MERIRKIVNIISYWIEVIVLGIIVILLYNDMIIYERIRIFFLVLLIIWVYIRIIKESRKYILEYFKKIERKKEEERKKFLEENKERYRRVERIYKKKEIFFMNFLKKEIEWYYRMRRINWEWMEYRWIRSLVYFIRMNLIIIPIKIILYYYYKMLSELVNKTIEELIFKRARGLIISVIFLTNIIDNIKFYINGYEVLVIIIGYIGLIIFGIWISLAEESWKWKNKITIRNIISLRWEISIISYIYLRYIWIFNEGQEEKKFKENNYYLYFFIRSKSDILERGERLFSKEKFFKVTFIWEILQVVNDKKLMMSEIKNKPSIIYYYYIVMIRVWYWGGLREIGDLIWGLYKYREKKESYDEIYKMYKEMEGVYKYYIFKIWDMERSWGFKKNYYELENKSPYSIFLDELDLVNNNDKIEENRERFIDIEENLEIFEKIYRKMLEFEDKENFFTNDGEVNIIGKLCEKYELRGLDINYLTLNEIKERNIEVLDKGNLWIYRESFFPEELREYKEMMLEFMKRLREEWEEEWRSGRRDYFWKD